MAEAKPDNSRRPQARSKQKKRLRRRVVVLDGLPVEPLPKR
jgi:hypothetical protein